MRLRDDYTADCQRGLDRWNKIIEKTGVAFKLALPHVGFHRLIGEFKDVKVSPTGKLLDEAACNRDNSQWLPSKDDGDFIASLMQRVVEPGKFASWIARFKASTGSRGSPISTAIRYGARERTRV